MRLHENIIVREEDDGFLLYNGDNGGLVHLTHEAFERFLTQGITNGEGYEALQTCLFQGGFLENRPTESQPDPPASARAAGLQGFFNLRSQRSPFNVLWAVTPACNLRCIYCFPDVHAHVQRVEAQSLGTLLTLADQIIAAKVLKVILSGGECLLLPDIWGIAGRFRSAGLTVTLLSNGAPVTERVAERARSLRLTFGISLDGPDEQINATTRGVGGFGGAIRGISRLLDHDVPVSVLVTITRHNFEHIERLIALVASLGVDSVTLQDLRPFGTTEIYDRTRLTVTQEHRLQSLFERLRADYPAMNLETSELFLCWKRKINDRVMQCPAGDHFAYIDFHGDVYPCTSLPSFKLGNLLLGDSLIDLWQHSGPIKALRQLKNLKLTELPGCRACANEPCCDGGCRGDALFYRGDLLGRPSRCAKELGLSLR